jgi:anoctamin-10
MAICTNCLLLVCLYDEEGKWRIEPGLAAILIMEHALLLIKFGFSHFVPEVIFFAHMFCAYFMILSQ